MSGDVNQALAFITKVFHAGRAYSTCNIYHSLLSTTVKLGSPTVETDLGKHPQMIKLMTGIYNSRPPMPKYTVFWDPKEIIDYLQGMLNPELSLIQLS